MQKIVIASTLVLVLFWSAAGPAAAQNREHQQMTAELRMLQEQTQQVALALAQLADALKAINARMDTADQTDQKRFADQGLLIKALASDLNAIRERTQDTDTRLRSLADEIEALRSTVTSLPSLQGLSSAGGVADPGAGVDPNAPATSTATTTPETDRSKLGLSPSRMLETAKSDYYAGSYATAISGFESLLRAFPRTEAAGEAQYWLGETYSQQKRWQDAVNAYTTVIQTFPKSMWVPEAYYKRGRAEEQLRQTDLARASYEQLMKNFPDSPNAVLAKQALDRLGRSALPPRP
jgi:tol-pal system protein YbgF